MAVYVALLRAVNVGGTGKLPMAELRGLCEKAGFSDVSTYIQSGNVLFGSRFGEAKVKTTLEKALARHMGKPVAVLVRSADELADALKRNPFAKQPPNRVVAVFLDAPAPKRALEQLVAPGGEQVRLSGREIFIYYPNGQGRSKLALPVAAKGTARNINTVTKLSEMAAESRGRRR
jgi:uncharacterized protein (DUF1697 family)